MGLNPLERHLVVKVFKCEALPVADVDKGSSDPYLRVSWDNMVLKTPPIPETIRPIFNCSFYFPVRFTFHQLDHKKNLEKYEDTILKFELQTKGQIMIQVWDDDETSADFLGKRELNLQELFEDGQKENRSLRGSKKNQTPEEELMNEGKTPLWYDDEKKVRVFNGKKVGLAGSDLLSNSTPSITFEAYFFPDFPGSLRVKSDSKDEAKNNDWLDKRHSWEEKNTTFRQFYAMNFPDSIGALNCEKQMVRIGLRN
jgi:hypothetical protein